MVERTSDKAKLVALALLARVLRLPGIKGRVTISEFAYKLLSPAETIVSFYVAGRPVFVDLSQQELRYVYFGAFEPAERKFLTRYLREGDVAIDVGANFGYLSALMVRSVGATGAVHAFEPNPYVYPYLAPLRNASGGTLNTYQIALGSYTSKHEDEKIRFRIDREHSMWSSIVPTGGPDPTGDTIQVDVVTLSDFFQEHQLRKVNLIKIDVEGAESEVLKGLVPYLPTVGCPTILCEICPGNATTWNETVTLIKKLMDLEYEVFVLAQNGSLEALPWDRLVSRTATQNVVFATKSELAKRL